MEESLRTRSIRERRDQFSWRSPVRTAVLQSMSPGPRGDSESIFRPGSIGVPAVGCATAVTQIQSSRDMQPLVSNSKRLFSSNRCLLRSYCSSLTVSVRQCAH